MRTKRTTWAILVAGWALCGPLVQAQEPLADYFRAEVDELASKPLGGIRSAERWTAQRPELQRRLREMMGLDPWPERTPLRATVTETLDKPEFVVEKLHYQSSPGLYVTANLFRPKNIAGKKLPAILYVCGHGRVEKDGIIYGNKAHYNHHAAWFAANGYVCLVVDTLQLGELPGLHHGTYREGMWWWMSRGYTPAGIEAWNGIRGIDYLVSRPEVDPKKIGVTGRSGGGATSWWLGALDDRVAALVPVAGITDLQNHVVDGAVQGHCDCMYFVNTYRWDYTLLAALCAPKPMLVENTNLDPIFPEDGVRRVYQALETVYGWYGASDRLGLLIGDGGHVDSIELRHPAFAFFEKWLKGETATIEEPNRKLPVEELKVLKPGEVPPDNRNNTIHESFVAQAPPPPVPANREAWSQLRARWRAELRGKVFGGWPTRDDVVDPKPVLVATAEQPDRTRRTIEFTSEPGVRIPLVYVVPKGRTAVEAIRVVVGSDAASEGNDLSEGASALVVPRGVGQNAWPQAKDGQIRRRFYLLGQTLDGQRVWDVRRALALIRERPETKNARITLVGEGPMATVALWAAVFEPEVAAVELIDPPATVRDGPAYLNLERVLNMPQAVALLFPRPLTMRGTVKADDWRWASDLADRLAPRRDWPTIEPAGSAQP
jgi:dienelactone hydrolase